MARPTRLTIASGIAAWDADTDENFDILTEAPIPFFQVAVVGSLPAASAYDDCFALVADVLYYSDGATWAPYQVSDNVPDSTATTATQMATDFNTLLAALIAAGIMSPT